MDAAELRRRLDDALGFTEIVTERRLHEEILPVIAEDPDMRQARDCLFDLGYTPCDGIYVHTDSRTHLFRGQGHMADGARLALSPDGSGFPVTHANVAVTQGRGYEECRVHVDGRLPLCARKELLSLGFETCRY